MKRVVPLLCTAMVLGSIASVVDAQQQAQVLTEEDAVRIGLERNKLILAARADADGAQALHRQVQAARLPKVSANADYRRLVGDIPQAEFTFPDTDTPLDILTIPRNQVRTDLGVEQPLFQGFRLRNRARAAAHEAEAAGLMAEQTEADVAYEIRRIYWELHRASALQVSVEAALASVEAHLQDIERRFDEGTVLRSDLLAARTRRSQVLLDRIEVNNAAQVARLEMSRLIGVPVDADTLVQPAPNAAKLLTQDLASLREQAVATRPELKALDEQLKAHRQQIDIAQGAWLPNVGLFARYIYARPNPLIFAELDQFQGIGEAGVVLRWNLFEGGRRSAETAQARAGLIAAQARFEEARERAVVRVTRQYLEVTRANQALAVSEEHIEEAKESFRVVSEQFAEGVVVPAQVLVAEQVLRSAQARVARAVSDVAVANARLLNVLGEVW